MKEQVSYENFNCKISKSSQGLEHFGTPCRMTTLEADIFNGRVEITLTGQDVVDLIDATTIEQKEYIIKRLLDAEPMPTAHGSVVITEFENLETRYEGKTFIISLEPIDYEIFG